MESCPVKIIDVGAERSRTPSRAARQASRLFYCPKASRRERDAGCEALPPRALDLFPNAKHARRPPPATNPHPTVKPLALMRCLIRLAVPEGGLVLDPFCGSGSTGCAAALEGRRFLGIELDPAYAEIARARIGTGAGPPKPKGRTRREREAESAQAARLQGRGRRPCSPSRSTASSGS